MKEWERSPHVPIEDEPKVGDLQASYPRPEPVRNPPLPGFSPEKWAAMSRPERRAAERAARRYAKLKRRLTG
jgi:hypothetical protein